MTAADFQAGMTPADSSAADGGAVGPSLETVMVAEQHRVLVRFAPYLYGVVMIGAAGVGLVERRLSPSFVIAAAIGGLAFGLLVRFLIRARRRRNGALAEPGQMRRDLRFAVVVAPALTFGLCLTAAAAAAATEPLERTLLLFAIWAAAVAGAFCLIRVAYAAVLIILSAATPLTVLILLGRDAFSFWLAALLVVASCTLILLAADTRRSFEEMVGARYRMERKRREAEDAEKIANTIAHTDYLTSLPNRRWMQSHLAAHVAEGPRRPFAIGLLDLDGFKPINDIHGHAFGDAVLRETARRLTEALHGRGAIARMGGDEFAVLYEGLSTQAEALALGEDLRAVFADAFTLHQRTIHLSCTFGFALFPEAARDADKLVRLADAALYRAKGKSRGGVSVFDANDERAAMERARLEQALHNAVADNSVEVAFQPIVDLGSGRVNGFEALARWRDPGLGAVSPSVFIPVAEQLGIIDRLSRDLLRKAALAATRWPERIALSFNLSAEQLSQKSTQASILEVLADAGLPPSRLEIEVTETAILKDVEAAAATVDALRAAGVRVALDDFGAGYSSLGQLRDLELDTIKIDRSFVERVCEDPKIANLTRSIIEMARSLDLPCIAEGIESTEQLEALWRIGCAAGQGWLFAGAMPASEIDAYLEAHDGQPLTLRQAASG